MILPLMKLKVSILRYNETVEAWTAYIMNLSPAPVLCKGI